jgi:hypothetical protein
MPDPAESCPIDRGGDDEEREIIAGISEAMRAAGIREEYILAWEETGLIVWEGNVDRIDPDALSEWKAAVARHRGRGAEPPR